MEINKKMKKNLIIFMIFCLWSVIQAASNPINSFKTWNIKDGFASSYCTDVRQYRDKHLFIQHGDSQELTVFDGYVAHIIELPEKRLTIKQVKDGVLWGGKENRIYQYNYEDHITDGVWAEVKLPELEPDSNKIISFVPNINDDLYIMFETSVILFDRETNSVTTVLDQNSGLNELRGIFPYQGQVLINCQKGIAIVDNDLQVALQPLSVDSLERPMRITISNDDAIYAIAINQNTNQREQIVFEDSRWKVLFDDHDFQTFFYNADGYYWGFDLRNEEFIRKNDFKKERITKRELIFSQFEEYSTLDPNSFSIATPEGLVRYDTPLWTEYSFQNQIISHNIVQPSPNEIFTLSKFNSVVIKDNTSTELKLPKNGMFLQFETENVGQFNNTLYTIMEQEIEPRTFFDLLMGYDVEQQEFFNIEVPFEYKSLFLTQLDPEYITLVLNTEDNHSFYQFDGTNFTHQFDLSKEISIGDIRYLLLRDDGFWICGTRGLLLYQDGNITNYTDDILQYSDGIHCVIALNENEYWFGENNGILSFDGNQWKKIIGDTQDVRSLFRSSDGSIWAACTDGVRRFFNDTWIHYTFLDGLPKGAVFEVFETMDNELIIGTNYGIWKFNPTFDTDKPIVQIDTESSYKSGNVGGEYQLNVIGNDRWKYTTTDRLFYSYSFDQNNWSEFVQNARFPFHNLPAKDYTVYVRAMDLNGNISTPEKWGFSIPKPWYQQMGFFISLSISLLIILSLMIIAFIGHIKLRNSYTHLQQTKDHLIQSEKMASLGQLIAGVAHEINNPINYIKSNIDPLREYFVGYKNAILTMNDLKDRLPEDIKKEYETIVEKHELNFANEDSIKIFESYTEGTDRISKIVADLRQYSRSDKEYKTAISINDSINSTLNLLQSRLKYGIQLNKEFGDLPKFSCSPGQLGQVFMNLLSNAIDAVGNEGEINIKTYVDPYNIIVAICDNGPGIPNDIINKIFDPFFTTKPVGSGTGLGLSITHKIVEQHDGKIEVNSEVGKGTEFVLYFPVKE